MDSIVLLHKYQQKIGHVLNFSYGAKHNERERLFARKHAKILAKSYQEVDLDFVAMGFKSNLLIGEADVPDGHYEDQSMRQTVVPFRNGIMLSIACGIAESRELNQVYYGAHSGDHAIYPDCRTSFRDAMSEAMRIGTYIGVTIEAPFTGISKSEIAQQGELLGVDFAETWSCYRGENVHCGRCGTCIERKEALATISSDPTEYQS
ncbi:UNVERIFIED_CONTAM: hypothetical protein GTU68_018176 [Idotea baltica]|nr:hypothetical protein [Idotea baltica]